MIWPIRCDLRSHASPAAAAESIAAEIRRDKAWQRSATYELMVRLYGPFLLGDQRERDFEVGMF